MVICVLNDPENINFPHFTLGLTSAYSRLQEGMPSVSILVHR